LESSRLLSWSHFSLPKLQHLLAYMCLFHYHGIWCPVYCWGWFIPRYGYLAFLNIFYLFWYRLITLFVVKFYPCFCLQNLQHLLAYIFLFYYQILWCPVYFWGRFLFIP
jgi:hypothetical protein